MKKHKILNPRDNKCSRTPQAKIWIMVGLLQTKIMKELDKKIFSIKAVDNYLKQVRIKFSMKWTKMISISLNWNNDKHLNKFRNRVLFMRKQTKVQQNNILRCVALTLEYQLCMQKKLKNWMLVRMLPIYRVRNIFELVLIFKFKITKIHLQVHLHQSQ